ncbi:hypothetical protein Tco_0351942 [Tanacetum coccineum]
MISESYDRRTSSSLMEPAGFLEDIAVVKNIIALFKLAIGSSVGKKVDTINPESGDVFAISASGSRNLAFIARTSFASSSFCLREREREREREYGEEDGETERERGERENDVELIERIGEERGARGGRGESEREKREERRAGERG